MLKRSSLLSVLLLTAMLFVGMRTCQLWQEGPWDLPKLGKGKDSLAVGESRQESPGPQLASTKNTIEKNLFDPERGAGRTEETEGSSVGVQRVRSMILLGTAILGNSRYAILQEPSDSRPSVGRGQTGQLGQLRLKLGDTVEGFKLSEVHEKRVVFTKGASRVELALDFYRKIEDSTEKARAPAQAGPVTPRVARPPLGAVPTPPVMP